MKEVLESHGFSPYEAQIYLCLLENGPLTAYGVAEKTGLYRQVTYDSLNRLAEQARVTVLRQERRQLFQAADPAILLDEARQKQEEFEKILPAMAAMRKASASPVEVEVFRGKHVLKLAFKDIVRTLRQHGGESCCTAVDERHYSAYDSIALSIFEREMLRFGLKERVIIKEGAPRLMPSETTEYRTVPERYFNSHPVQIYGDTVQINLSGTPMHMILIRNQSIADSFKKQFELMWSVAKPIAKDRRESLRSGERSP